MWSCFYTDARLFFFMNNGIFWFASIKLDNKNFNIS